MELHSFDDKYLQKLREGDSATEAHFCSYFGKMLFLKLRTKVRSAESLDDVRQETFLRVLRAVRAEDGIHSPERFGAYVNSVCNFVLLEHYRSGKREDPMEEGMFDPPDHCMDQHQTLVAREASEKVRQTLDQLDRKEREILTQLFLLERDKDEICREFGVDREYLRVLVYRAKGHFRTKFNRVN